MSDFEVVLADLDALHASFANEATTYEQLIPSINPPAVDSGAGDLNSVLQALVETFDVAHHREVEKLHAHADQLKVARDTFEQADAGWWFQWDGTRSLYDNVVPKDQQP
jgi:hypothetical protein